MKTNQSQEIFVTLSTDDLCSRTDPEQDYCVLKYASVFKNEARSSIATLCTISCLCIYVGLNDVTESMVTIRSPFCGYNLA